MALSVSRPDPSSPASVADASFSTARRGYDQGEVRDLLRAVAAELGRLQERERFLERELRTSREQPPLDELQLDDETVTRLLGEETARVLQTARESASQIRHKAEEAAERILRDATDEANRLREEAEVEAARRRSDAAADADAELSLAKQQGREMVNEARAYRERVLSELARRRELAREQIEQLIEGRDRLLQVFERARLVAVDVVADLTPLTEPDEYVDLTPTTGPVPMMVPATPRGAAATDELVDDEPSELDADAELDDVEPLIVDDADTGEISGVDLEEDEPPAAELDDDADADDAAAGADDRPTADAATNVVALFPTAASEREADVDGLFARLRAETADTTTADTTTADTDADDEAEVASDASIDDAAEVDDTDTEAVDEPSDESVDDAVGDEPDDEPVEETVFARRDADLVPLIVAGARKLKRVLADEQNDVLDTLRRKEPVLALDALLPGLGDHVDRYTAAIDAELREALAAGAATVGDADPGLAERLDAPGVLDTVHQMLRSELIEPLRSRLERAVAAGDGDNDDITKGVRAVYREWKTQHIDDQLDDVFRLAHGTGILRAVSPGTPMCWLVDPDGPACPDAEDNALAGVVPAGEAYPTGHVCAPAHAGCRCVLSVVGH